jgi:FdhD protein
MTEDGALVPRGVIRITEGREERTGDVVVDEAPFTLYLNGREFVTLVCLPRDLEELAVGFLYTEGLLRRKKDLSGLEVDRARGIISVNATPSEAEQSFLRRYVTSCCGRGRAAFYFVNDARNLEPVTAPLEIDPSTVGALMAELEQGARTFHLTGGVHAAALAAPVGIVYLYEDVGRHNAVDKVCGRTFLEELDTRDKLLLLSGRVTAEMVVKAARLGVPVLVSRAAPTNLALELAVSLGLTVVGFARGNRMNVYTYPVRVRLPAKTPPAAQRRASPPPSVGTQ